MSVSYSPLRNHNLEMADGASANTKPKNPAMLSPSLMNSSAPLAISEIDDRDDDRETVTGPYPGVDDGFFNGVSKNDGIPSDAESLDPRHPDVEVMSNKPKDPEPLAPPDEIPTIFNRSGPDEGDEPDRGGKGGENGDPANSDGEHEDQPQPRSRRPSALFPGYGHDLEFGSAFPSESIPDVNIYQHKKTLAQGMMDLALFSANANQLRYVLESYARHPYFHPSVILISISLILQVAVGIGLTWNATYNVKDKRQICIANKINNFTVIGIFLITVVNVFISAFGVANAPTS
ncbi:hypothetical protein NQ318_001429 [Aromia moschata]|uniref:Ninjurin-1 n=1 Tax=Aromia moschata TaxID=1265417 RepID=A0AAV8YVC2_9CUCU|nr:hypothetical protein NQ318_001429 [Aromia moschata]